jgi:anaerobic selenocysteine-containing dehydrogenase
MPDTAPTNIEIRHSTCPHDCPSTCALEVERLDANTIGRVRGASANTYTDGVICAKVARYAERAHHPDRLMHPLMRTGPKGSKEFRQVSWDEALDAIAKRFLAIEAESGPEAIWPYFYAGTMGLVMRDGINRLRHAKRYSGQYSTVCTTLAFTGFIAGTGALRGADPREMAESDLVVIWGTNPVNTQVNVMTHAVKARKNRGGKIAVVDVYETGAAKQADIFVRVNPGTDAALACAVMHVLFRDGYADWDYLNQYTDCPAELEAHLKSRTPEWASKICGTPVKDIEAFAKVIGETDRTFFRLGYGFTRQRNGAVAMHAASCIPAVTGAWRHKGGGAFHNNGAIYGWDKTITEGLDVRDANVRMLDQARIGEVLTGHADALKDGPPIEALFIQNTNPMMIAPDHTKVREGFLRDDLLTVVHEQFMTETAAMADIVLPATMFTEHDDFYQGGGHQHISHGLKVVEPPGECRSNHEVICALAERLGAEHPGFAMSPRELIDATLKASKRPGVDVLEQENWFDVQPPFEQAHYLNGFAHPDGKFHFKADWSEPAPKGFGGYQPEDMPDLPDHWAVIDAATPAKPFRMATSPARSFLNSTFTETKSSRDREGRPTVQMRAEDAEKLGLSDGQRVRIGNDLGETVLHLSVNDATNVGVVIVESIWPNAAFETGVGINVLTSAEPGSPVGGAVYHDTAVWIKAA